MVDELMKRYSSPKKYQITSTTGCSSVLLSSNIQIHGKNLSVKTIHAFSGIRLCKGTNQSIVDNVIKNKRFDTLCPK